MNTNETTPIDRVLAEVRDAEKNGTGTLHNVYTSGLFEDTES
jgi:hypothetical protein